MKAKKNSLLILLIVMLPFMTMAQTSKQANTLVADKWQALNVFVGSGTTLQMNTVATPAKNMTNVLNGVSFYFQDTECNSQKVTLVKLINVNNHPVKVAWQMSPESTETFVLIPAAAGLEGSCINSNDLNKSKLVISLPEGPTREDVIKYVVAHITVSK